MVVYVCVDWFQIHSLDHVCKGARESMLFATLNRANDRPRRLMSTATCKKSKETIAMRCSYR